MTFRGGGQDTFCLDGRTQAEKKDLQVFGKNALASGFVTIYEMNWG